MKVFLILCSLALGSWGQVLQNQGYGIPSGGQVQGNYGLYKNPFQYPFYGYPQYNYNQYNPQYPPFPYNPQYPPYREVLPQPQIPIVQPGPTVPVVDVLKPMSQIDSAVYELDKKGGHSEKYYYGRSNLDSQEQTQQKPRFVNSETPKQSESRARYYVPDSFPDFQTIIPQQPYYQQQPYPIIDYNQQYPFPNYLGGYTNPPAAYIPDVQYAYPVRNKPVIEEIPVVPNPSTNPAYPGKKPFNVDKKTHYEVYVYE